MKHTENIYSHLARFFVQNRQLALLLTIASFIFGLFAFMATPKQYNPEITLPAFRIVTQYPGATASEVEKQVTDEVENKIMEIPGVDTLTSQSLSGGTSVVMVVFNIGTKLDASKTEVIQKMQSNLNLAPLGVGAPLIQQVDPENVPVMTLAITSKDLDTNSLRQFAFDLKDQIKTVSGVTNIAVTGGHARQLTVLLNPNNLAARGVSVTDVEHIIQANNLHSNAGNLVGSTYDIPIEIDGTLTSGDELGKLVVGGTPDAPVYLSDVATVSDGYDVIDNDVNLIEKGTNGDEKVNVVYLSFAKAQGVNITNVTSAVKTRLAELKQSFIPSNIDVRVTRDEGATAQDEIMKLTEHLAFAIGIVTLTLVFFLGWRPALVVATAIPLTLALVFVVGYFSGETINRITLFALIFSLGLLVDDAIVVIENIHRHFSLKTESKTEAIAHATGEVGMGVLLSTITAVIVFVPMGMVSGMMGAYMGPIAFFAPVARLASLVVAYTLSPFIASFFLHEHVEGDGDEHGGHTEHHSRLELWYKGFIHRLLDNTKLQNRILIGTLVAVVIAFSLPVFEFVHFRMLPKANEEQFYIYLDMPDNTAFKATDAMALNVAHAALTDPNVISVESFVGTSPVVDFNGLFRGSDMRTKPSQATMKVDLKPANERSLTSEHIVAAMRTKIDAQFANEPGVKIALVEDPPGPPVLSTLVARIKGPDPQVRDAIARDMLAQFTKTKGVVDIDSSLASGATEELLTIDHEKLSRSGLSVADVISTLQAMTSGSTVAAAHLDSRENTTIVMQFDRAARSQLSDLSRVQLKNSAGQMVALDSVVTIVPSTTPSAIQHDDREAMSTVMGEVQGRSIVYVVKDLIMAFFHYPLPSGHGKLIGWNLYGLTYQDSLTHDMYTIEWGGEFEMTLDNFRDLGMAMLVSYFLIYVVLVAQFRSFRSPALIMTAIILGFAGVMPGFAILDALAGTYFSATSMIGVIALGGIVVGNAILLLDFIEQLRARGNSAKFAIVEACKTRLRPIMLTSITAILGSVVIVTDSVWNGLAWAIIFGLSLSTVLTLVIFPILYYRFGAEE